MRICLCTGSVACWGPQMEEFGEMFRECGHETLVLEKPLKEDAAPFDLLFYLGAADKLVDTLSSITARVRIMYAIEAIPTLEESDFFTDSKLKILIANGVLQADAVLVHTNRSVPMLDKLGQRRVSVAIWPCFLKTFRPVEIEKSIDVLFLGSRSPRRMHVLKALKQHCNLVAASGFFHGKAAEMISKAKIVLNLHYSELNNFECRVTEVLGCGGFLMTEELEPADELVSGEHLVTIDRQHVVEQINHFLRHPEERQKIARQGHQAAVKKFTIQSVVDEVLELYRQVAS